MSIHHCTGNTTFEHESRPDHEFTLEVTFDYREWYECPGPDPLAQVHEDEVDNEMYSVDGAKCSYDELKSWMPNPALDKMIEESIRDGISKRD